MTLPFSSVRWRLQSRGFQEGSYRRKTESLSEDYALTAARQHRKQAIPGSDARLNMGRLLGFMGF